MAFDNKPIRRTALIGPWGVGAIVPFPNDESLMIAGLDMWRYNDPAPFIITDERLQKRLKVRELRWPPDFRERNEDQVNGMLEIPAVRFPTWHYCPWCGSMHKASFYESPPVCSAPQWPNGRVCKPAGKRRRLVPERFIVVCPHGHIDDFPVAEWVHGLPGSASYNPSSCQIRRSTGGSSASLSGVFYVCTCGAKRSIAAATKPGMLFKAGLSCSGARPWLGEKGGAENQCGSSEAKVLIRGATNVWFGETISSLYIPTDNASISQRMLAVLDEYFYILNNSRRDGEIPRELANTIATSKNIDADAFYNAVVNRSNTTEEIEKEDDEISEEEYRSAEYKILISSTGSDAQNFHSIYNPISNYKAAVHQYFRGIALVPKLKETRALVGFSRIEPKNESLSDKKKTLRKGNGSWLPAIEVYGEGIFFHFNEETVKSWAGSECVVNRVNKLNNAYKYSFFNKQGDKNLQPEFVLLHTFAHVLINQISFDCGYGSSSIRERIYCEKQDTQLGMLGVLLYTASGDSEGSLGGLVRQGKPGRIEDLIIDAMKNALWCTSDPICIQSTGQGPESCNLAACHSCALLPETCCENGNRLLDRALLIGTLDNSSIGYFSRMIEEAEHD